MSDVAQAPHEQQTPRWRPLAAMDRRVLGVLIEKAKTTPDVYPMSIAALKSGCNQKNNRYPLTELELEDIEESLARLRAVGAVSEVQGSSRVNRYKHLAYEWLGVDKLELAVMAELLLRGAQTEGELRGRAARMDPIPDLNALRPLLTSLKSKGLILPLTPEGRGHVLTHALYEERELAKLRAEHAGHSPAANEPVVPPATWLESQAAPRPAIRSPAMSSTPETVLMRTASAVIEHPSAAGDQAMQISELRQEVDALRS